MATELESARAISAALADDLRAVGVHDLRDLEAIGAGDAWERLLEAGLRDSLADRLALEAAVRGRRVGTLDPETRERCAAHVRHRVAPEPRVAAPRASGFTVGRPSPTSPRQQRERRVVYWAIAGVALLLAAAIVVGLLSQ